VFHDATTIEHRESGVDTVLRIGKGIDVLKGEAGARQQKSQPNARWTAFWRIHSPRVIRRPGRWGSPVRSQNAGQRTTKRWRRGAED
jgi:hypothetical protein